MLLRISEGIASDEEGFTLVELLVVILIVGILAAIALPAFLGQRQKGQDVQAKSNVRNLAGHMESCFTTKLTYIGCNTFQDVTNRGIPVGTGIGKVVISSPSATGYTLLGTSKATAVAPLHTYRWVRSATGVVRSCAPLNEGACSAGKW